MCLRADYVNQGAVAVGELTRRERWIPRNPKERQPMPDRKRPHWIARLAAVASLFVLSHGAAASAQVSHINCSTTAIKKIDGAWSFITGTLRNNAGGRAAFVDCIINAPLVLTGSCAIQENRSPIYLPLIETDYDWTFECKNLLGPEDFLASAHVVKIEGARMNIDIDYAEASSTTVLELASVIGHELMHNRGFDHPDDINDPFYRVSVPEQVRACIKAAVFGGPGNPPPYTDFWDRKHCCPEPRPAFSDSRGSYRGIKFCTTSGVCVDGWQDVATGNDIGTNDVFIDAFMCFDGSI
jgi:hypothetical protein